MGVLNNMGDHILLDLNEWALILNKMLRYHYNISEEIKTVVQSIRTEMRPELIPLAEEKANFGKEVKTAVREMWGLEYVKTKYGPSIMDLEIMVVPRPAKRPDEADAEPEKVEAAAAAAAGEAAPAEAAAGEAAPPA